MPADIPERRTPSLVELIGALERRYDPTWAEAWDAVGLVCGDPDGTVESVLFAVDPVEAVVAEAIASKADLLVTHHPLFLKPVHGVPASDPKGRLVHRLIEGGCALYVAHTNADVALPGVSDALADALHLGGLRPLLPAPDDPLDAIVTYVPEPAAAEVLDAMSAAGAGAIGAYSRCAFTSAGTGTFLPGPGSHPAVGAFGQVAEVAESRLEMVLPRGHRRAVVAALRSAHPYEEPAFSVVELGVGIPTGRGTGRVGTLPRPQRLRDFVQTVAAALPATAAGVRATGDPEGWIETVAVCGGSGGGYVEAARAAGADAYVTADLKHHPTSEAMEVGRLALLDVTHWASEWPFLAPAAGRLKADLSAVGATVSTRVSTLVTDPWTLHARYDTATSFSGE